MITGYLALESKRALRNPRSLVFTIIFPVVLFLVWKSLYGKATIQGTNVTYVAYLMCSMSAFGAFTAALNTGARTAVERSLGWQRQLRLTPLTPGGYLLAKVGIGMVVALPPVLLVSLCGALSGVRLTGPGWIQVVIGVWFATLPFAVLGLLVGQLAAAESTQVYTSGLMLLLSLLGGLWIPVTLYPHWLATAAKALPSYWLGEIGRGAVLGNSHTPTAVLVLAAWTVVLALAVVRRYRRAGARV